MGLPDYRGVLSSDAGQPDILVEALQADRKQLLVSDALRSLLLIAAAYLIILWGVSGFRKNSAKAAVTGNAAFVQRRTAVLLVCILALGDLCLAGKRYLNADDFRASSTSVRSTRPYSPTRTSRTACWT